MTTSSYNPILGREDLPPWWMFWLRPQLKPGLAMVLIQNRIPAIALTENDRAKLSLFEWRSYQSAYWVDMAEQTFTFQCRLPSKTPGVDFQAEAHVTYQVNKPIEIVRQKITNARAVIEPRLVKMLRVVAREFEADQCMAAEARIYDEAKSILTKTYVGQGNIEIIDYFVTLDLEEEERNHARRMRALTRNYDHSKQLGDYQEVTDNQQKGLFQSQVHFYNQLIQAGHDQLLLLYLASNRADIQPILEALNKQRQQERDHWLKMFHELRAIDALETHDLDILRAKVLAKLTETKSPANAIAAPVNGAPKNDTPTSDSGSTAVGNGATPPVQSTAAGSGAPPTQSTAAGDGTAPPAQDAAASAGTPPAQGAAAAKGATPAQGAPADKGAAPAQSAAAGKGATPAQGAPADKGAAPSAQATPAAPATGPTISEPVVPVEIADDPPDIAQTPPP